MPQMSPILWLNLFLMFFMIFLLFNVLNYYSYTPIIKNLFFNKSSLNKKFNWKW